MSAGEYCRQGQERCAITRIVIDPLTRVEGHSRLTIQIEEGRVVDVKFNAIELRGFESFVRGSDANSMPHVVSRICGVCSTAHHVASVRALENAYGVKPPKRAESLRELMLLGQAIESHAMSLFFLAMPDFYDKKASVFAMMDVDSEVTKRAVLVRKAGTEIIAKAGKRGIHPTNAVAGGVFQVFDRGTADALKELINRAIVATTNLLDRTWDTFLTKWDEVKETAARPTHYITAWNQERSFYGDELLVINPSGQVEGSFKASQTPDFLTIDPREESFAPIIHYEGKPIRTNSLARINAYGRYGTPLADAYAERFERDWGLPAHSTLLFDICRGIEIVFALERSLEVIERCLEPGPLIVKFKMPKEGTGIGLVEAPRGMLFHEYHIEKGLVESARFYIPTQHNLFALEQAIADEAQAHVYSDRIDMALESEVEKVIRAFDLCVSCATHEVKVDTLSTRRKAVD